jgi:proteasome accessory factor A
MSVHRIMGIESEFGISAPDEPHANPVILSSQVVNAYGTDVMPNRPFRMRWDYDVETPLRDARGFDMSRAEADPSQLTADDYGMANLVLFNGARFYVDHAHPEYSSPEVTNPRDAALYDAAGDRIMERAARIASRLTGQLITSYKNNTDGKGVSYGSHENYQVNREVPFTSFVRYLTPFFVTRCVFAGAGRVGLGQEGYLPGFQISQRADFFEAEVGLETTLRRPIINTRDEPHADPELYRRLHVIVGDANMSQRANYLKLGTTALVLSMIEAGFLDFDLQLNDPVASMHQVSHDVDFATVLALRDGRTISALEIQRMYIDAAHRYVEQRGSDEMTLDVLSHWTRQIETLATNPTMLVGEVDWIAKRAILEGYRARDHSEWDDPRLAAVDIQYADLRADKGLARVMQAKGRQQVMFSEDEIARAVQDPPHDTRAYFRGMCMRTFTENVTAASWDSVIMDVGPEQPLRRITTSDARKGTEALTKRLFELPIDEFLSKVGA